MNTTTTILAAVPDLTNTKNQLITLAGVAFICLIVWRMLAAYAKKNWGELAVEVIAIIVVGYFIWTPDSAIATLQEVTSGIFVAEELQLALPTDTVHVRMQTKQYKLLGLDLGEGVERSTLKVIAGFLAPWWALMWMFGPAPIGIGLFVWLLPPILFCSRAVTRDAGGRLLVRGWFDAVQWRLTPHRPVVNGDTAPGHTPQPIRVHLAPVIVSTDRSNRA